MLLLLALLLGAEMVDGEARDVNAGLGGVVVGGGGAEGDGE